MQYRKVQLKGYMTYGQAFSANFLIGLFAAIVSTIFFFFYIKYINTGLIEEILAQARTKIEAKAGNMSQEQMDQAMMWTERFMTPVWMVIWGFLGYAFWAAIFSLIISIFMRKKNPNAPTMI
jgi:ABC-type antimicrobial peptide transport system permease subunit